MAASAAAQSATKTPKSQPPPQDIYDEEFHNNLKLVKNLINQIYNDKDKEICKKWIRKLLELKSNDPVVKKNRNGFFRYLISVIYKGLERGRQFPHYDDKVPERLPPGLKFASRWSADKRTYIAAKPIPGMGTMVYLAVAKDPSLGWDHPR